MKLAAWTVLLLTVLVGATTGSKTRAKRLVGLRKGSKFYLRFGIKDTILNNTNIFAQAVGFKVTWETPEGNIFLQRRPVRALHDDVEFLFNRHGFDGKSCLLNNICQVTEYVSQRSGVVAKILRLLSGYSNYNNASSVLEIRNCDVYERLCPMEFIGIDTELG